jgi:hypothetical protein
MLPLARVSCVLSLLFALPCTALAQQNSTAVAIATRALSAMGSTPGAASPTDSRASGVLTMYFQPPLQMNIMLESKGLTQTRAQVQLPTGTSIRIVNGGHGAIQNADGSVRQLVQVNLFAERVGHIPAFSLLAEIQNPAAMVELIDSSVTNSTPDDVIAVSLGQSPDPEQINIQRRISRTIFYVDHASGLVDKIQYIRFTELPHPGIPARIEQSFSDYRNVGGISVPFHNATTCDGRLESDLQLNSVSFNVGVPDADFTLPGGAQ